MSWNLIIYKPGDTPEQNQTLGDLASVAQALTSVFTGLEWESPTEALLPVDGGIRFVLTEENGSIQDIYTHGGFNQITQLAALCKRKGWRIGDAQEGEDVDLDDPQRWYKKRNG